LKNGFEPAVRHGCTRLQGIVSRTGRLLVNCPRPEKKVPKNAPVPANPYAVTATFVEPSTTTAVPTNLEQIRRQHLKIERAITSIGAILGFAALAIGLLAYLRAINNRPGMEMMSAVALLIGLLGYGLMSCRAWARWPAILLSLPLLIGFPWGTVIGLYVLYALLCSKSFFVLTANYREIRRRTKKVNATNAVTWIMLGLMIMTAAWLYLQGSPNQGSPQDWSLPYTVGGTN
jgi:hypothetical protein